MSKKSKKQKSNSGNTENYTKRILSILRQSPGKPLNYKQIAARMGKEDPQTRNQIIKDLAKLAGKSKIDQAGRGKYKIAQDSDYYEGVLDMTSTGNGYVVIEELEQDVFIPNRKLNHALDGDVVQIFLFDDPHKKKLNGEIVNIIQRKTTSFVGILQLRPTFGFVEIRNPKMYVDIFVPRNKTKKAKDGEVVKVEIEKWPKNVDSPEGKITQVLGKPGEHETEMQSILAENNLAGTFSKEVEEAASRIDTHIRKEEIKNRRDMREDLTFTIDPRDSKDFDDALSFKKLENGNCEVGVHIADVSFYVAPGSILDEEAYERGNSIYLVDRTIPMLPEVLSNEVCSLRPYEEKYTFSAVFELDSQAKITSQWFGRTVIRSDARFAYEEAQQMISTQRGDIPAEVSLTNKAYTVKKELVEATLTLNSLAKKLRAKRMQSGAITFDTTEVKFNLDADNNPVGIYFRTQKEANNLIEEFMLLANQKVSEFVSKQKPEKTFVYRCHDEPNTEKLTALKSLVHQFGYNLNFKDRKSTTQSLNQLLNNVQGKKEENLVSTLTVRAMSKAYYSTQNIGHYGLAFAYYSHFTSPIRRYPDILAHRLLLHYLEHRPSVNAEEYEEKCKHCSQTERFAAEAERDSVKYMQVKFMQQFKGQTFRGVISGVTDFGIFVEIIENKCEGMVRLRDIPEDHFDYIEEKYAVVGRNSGKVYQLGDEVSIEVKTTDLVKRNLDFRLVDPQ